jgi:hypothetical protein
MSTKATFGVRPGTTLNGLVWCKFGREESDPDLHRDRPSCNLFFIPIYR